MKSITTENLVKRVILLMNDGQDSGDYFNSLLTEVKKRLKVD